MPAVSLRAVWALGALVALAYASVLVGGETFAHLGWLGDVVPARQAAGDAVASGHLPGWWAEAGFGVPLLAEPDHGALYPPAWVAALGGGALDAVAVAHLWLLAIGTAALAGRLGADTAGSLLAGAAVSLSAIAGGALVGGTLFAIAWAPLAADRAFALAEAAERAARVRAALSLAGCLAACKLAGTPILADAAMATVVIAGMARGRLAGLAWCAGASVASLLLAAIQIAPYLMLTASGHTAGSAWTSPGVGLLELLAPGATGGHGALYGGGAAVIALALCTRSRWLAVPGLLLLAALARPPIAALAWAWLAALAGAGLGTLTREPVPTERDELDARRRARRAREAMMVPAAVLGALGTVLAAVVGVRNSLAGAVDRAGLDGARMVEHAQWRGLVALGFAAVTLGLAVVAARRRVGALAALAALVALAEVALAGRAGLPRRARDAGGGPLIEALARAAPTRVFRNDAPARAGGDRDRDGAARRADRDGAARGADRDGAGAVAIDDALAHAAASSAAPRGIAAVPGRDPGRLAVEDLLPAATASMASRLLDRYAIPHALVPATVVTAAGFTVVAKHGDEAVVTTGARRTAGFWVSRWRHVDDARALVALAPPPGETAEPLGTVLLAGGGDAGGDVLAAPRPCTVTRPHAAEVRMACEVSAPGYAVLMDAWGPGWIATVDGKEVAVERADLIARAVRVAPGARAIVFEYTPPGFWLGAAISALALINAGLLLWVTGRKR